MKTRDLHLLITLLLAFPVGAIASSEKEELLKLKNTTINLIDALVQQGILDKKKAESIVQQAESKAARDTKREMDEEKVESAKTEGQTPVGKSGAKGESAPVRVTYVPEFVKDEIRSDVRKELRDEVVKEVKTQAKNEKWGVPAALPDWVNRFKLLGDFRLRWENQFFGNENYPNSYFNWPAINARGGIYQAGEDAFFNTTEDRQRYRIRLRLGMDAQIDENFKAGVRLTTSNDRNPISINQTLGQYGEQYEIALDRAYLQYDYVDGKNVKWLTAWGGRFINPFFSTDNVHDPDLSFEGIASTFRLPLGAKIVPLKDDAFKLGPQYRQINFGFSQPDSIFMTLGAFPLQEIALESTDKWMWGAQGGFDWMYGKSTRLKMGVAYYDYKNIIGIPNALGSTLNDWTAPQFFTRGNSVIRISNDVGERPDNPRRVGLAADFNILDAIFSLDYAGFGENHVMLTGNFSQNIGFDQNEILRRSGENITPKINAYQVRLDAGRPEITKFGDWSSYFAYKYLERDSVLDAFADSVFHLSGTDAKGWVAGLQFGVAKNTWLNARWVSADAVDGPYYVSVTTPPGSTASSSRRARAVPFGVDVLLIDLNARF